MNNLVEFIKNNKGSIIRICLLLIAFFVTVAYINGRNIYKAKLQEMQTEQGLSVRL